MRKGKIKDQYGELYSPQQQELITQLEQEWQADQTNDIRQFLSMFAENDQSIVA